MGDNWYCMIFGEEWGPMSWDDLANMAAHGMLGRRERVKQGADAGWTTAELVPGLFPDVPAMPANDPNIRREPSSLDDTDVKVAASPHSASAPSQTMSEDADFDLAPSVRPASSDGSEFDVAGPTETLSAETSAGEAEHVLGDTASAAPSRAERSGSEIGRRPAEAPQAKKKREKTGSGLSARSRRALTFIISALGAIGVVYLVYLGVAALAAMRSPNYEEILAGYNQLFQKAKAAQSDPSLSADPQAAMDFLQDLRKLRERLHSTAPDSLDTELADAGTLLAQLFASAAARPGSEAAGERSAAEKEYLAKISAVRSKLGK